MTFFYRSESNSNTICLKGFRKIHVLKNHLQANFTLAFLDIYQNGFFELNQPCSWSCTIIPFQSAVENFFSQNLYLIRSTYNLLKIYSRYNCFFRIFKAAFLGHIQLLQQIFFLILFFFEGVYIIQPIFYIFLKRFVDKIENKNQSA